MAYCLAFRGLSWRAPRQVDLIALPRSAEVSHRLRKFERRRQGRTRRPASSEQHGPNQSWQKVRTKSIHQTSKQGNRIGPPVLDLPEANSTVPTRATACSLRVDFLPFPP